MFLTFFRTIFNYGFAPMATFYTFGAVSYLFFVTFTVSLFDKGIRKFKKRFFFYVSVFATLFIFGVCALDYFSARYFSPFEGALYIFISAGVFMLEYGVLSLQSLILVKDKQKEKVEKTSEIVVKNSEQNSITPVKRRLTGKICEFPSRTIEIRKMEKPNVAIEGNNYLKGCVAKLKAKKLSDNDEDRLSVVEGKLSSIDKKDVNEACGILITLLAKYL